MAIVEVIENKINALESDDFFRILWSEVKKIVGDSNQHLKQITAQLNNYDIHDEQHCNKVLSNIELILGDEVVKSLNLYEQVLIYASSFLHDSAMALPVWEYEMLRAVEGTKECYNNSVKIRISNDLKPINKLSEIINFIDSHKKEVYGCFNDVSKFVFSSENEQDFLIDLAERVREYERFRNEYSDDLKLYLEDTHQFISYSDLIRAEFIRSTHHLRIEKYILNVKKHLKSKVAQSKIERFTSDLSQICRSHGECFQFVKGLNHSSIIDEKRCANIQFVSMLLRLGYVIHFSIDRAPISLFSEKRITDPTSIMHWKAKFEELTYSISIVNEKTTISFSAFCSEPEIYYFIQDYLDWIDSEISNFYSMIQHLEIIGFKEINTYKLPLALNVNRKEVVSDKTKFIPEANMKFTLEQSKILSLLMGVQLYKDKYLCIRELYQNSMDACKFMQSHNFMIGNKEEFSIEFGMGEQLNDGKSEKYIYCLDNGTGMTKEIVNNYFLRIGNSYYKSREFAGERLNSSKSISPTSKFGIGILSCFMIAKRIEVTTKYFDDRSNIFCFSMNGANEHFYYLNPNPLDDECIGSHGTLVKLFLDDECAKELNNEFFEKAYFYIHLSDGRFEKYEKEIDKFKHSLFYTLNSQVAISHPDINVYVRENNIKKHELLPRFDVFDFRRCPAITTEDIEALWSRYTFADGSLNPYKDVIACRDFIKDVPILVKNHEIELYSFISLPLMGIPICDKKIFSFSDFTWPPRTKMLVDGIKVSNEQMGNFNPHRIFGYYIDEEYVFNFIGEQRPELSIDRETITSMPNSLESSFEDIEAKFIEELAVQIEKHMRENNIEPASSEAILVLDLLYVKFPLFAIEIARRLASSTLGNVFLSDLEMELGCSFKINEIITSKEIKLLNVDFRSKSQISKQMLVGKAAGSEMISLIDSNIKIVSEKFEPFDYPLGLRQFKDSIFNNIAIRTNSWDGAYKEYDMVTHLWPFVPPCFYDSLCDPHSVEELIVGKVKIIDSFSNGIAGIAQLKAELINPKFGISSISNHFGQKKKSYIGMCDQIQNSYELFELNSHGEAVRKDKKDFAIFVFISPPILTEQDEIELKDYEGNDDIYIKGVREGWSILFLGLTCKYIIMAGIVAREEIVKQIPKSILTNNEKISYYFPDGTKVF